jgi:RecA/RadA recombinase
VNNPFEMVAFIVLVVMIASVVRAAIQNRGQRRSADDGEEARLLRDEVRQLKDRIQVLERITVEKENSLERQIEELRDR